MCDWNSVAMMQEHSFTHQFWTDASGCFRCGAVCLHAPSHLWLQLQWRQSYVGASRLLRNVSTIFKELPPITLVCVVWRARWWRLGVAVHCNNFGKMMVVNLG